MKITIRHLAFAGVALGLLALFYTNRARFVFTEADRFEHNLERFQQVDQDLNEDALKERTGILNDYDSFPTQIGELKRTLGELDKVPSFIPKRGGESIHRKVDDLSRLVQEKEQLVESFKSQNAVLNNSLDYLPVIGAELVGQVSAGEDTRELANSLNDLVQEVLAYSIRSSDERAAAIRDLLARTRAEWARRLGAQPAALASAAAHINSILRRKPRVEALTRQIISLPTGAREDELRLLFDHEIAEALQTSDKYRLLLQMLCSLLLFGVGCTIHALHRANTRLESRVRERTKELEDEVADHCKAETALRNSEERFRRLAETIQDVFWMTSPDCRQALYLSPGYERIWGRSCASACEQPESWFDTIVPEDRAGFITGFAKGARGEAFEMEYRITRPDGSVRSILSRGFPVHDEAGALQSVVGLSTDVTARKLMEAKLLEAGKLETVGRLAGGIAHDFNTILTAIIGHAELIGQAVPKGGPEFQSADQIGKSAARAAQLTQQLLAFSRKQLLQPRVLDLNAIVSEVELMLRRLLGGNIQVRVALNARRAWAKADAGQIQQMLVQLASNAQDAMPRGGRLTLETADITLDETYAAAHPDVAAGDFVMIAISDTGGGIADEVKPHLFEPFFTTKKQGEGAGLGLAMCYGIARQIGGHISVYSELGCGTTFKLLLPCVPTAGSGPAAPSAPVLKAAPAHGTESILLVEDDDSLRDLAGIVLEKLGYTVHAAANGVEAMRIAENHAEIALLLTDVVMPQMSGKELADRLRSSQPSIKVLYTSAYTKDAITHHGILDPGIEFLHKPYTPALLSRKTREALDGAQAPTG